MSADSVPSSHRISRLCELIDIMRHTGPPPSLVPKPPELPADPGALARDAADSAVLIAEAVAALGVTGDAQAHAQQIWTESLKQIRRIQNLYGLPPLPFAEQPSPGPQHRRKES